MSDNDITEEDIRAWDLPYIEEVRDESQQRTNAFNRRSDWKYEPPEEEPELLPPTAEEIEAIRQAAHQEGFEQGKAEGLEKGLAEGKEQGYQEGFELGKSEGQQQGLESGAETAQQHAQIWQSLVEQIQQPVAQVNLQLQQELLKLSVELAKAVIHSEIHTSNETLLQALSEGLKVLPIEESSYQIRLHPEDLQLVTEHFSAEYIEKQRWNLVESPDMSRGGCDIVTSSNAVDMSIERRIRDVIGKFLLEQGIDDSHPE